MLGMLLAVGLSASAAAAPESAMDMRSACQRMVDIIEGRPDRSLDGITVLDAGYCKGAFDVLLQTESMLKERLACGPSGSRRRVEQYVRVFVRYCDRHPERLHEPWLPIALSALVEAFPCKR